MVLLVAGVALAAEPAPRKPIVAVLYFNTPDQGQGRDEWLQLRKGLAEILITDLVADDQFVVVERARLEEVLAELKLQATSKFDKSTAQEVGKLLGAKYLVFGSIVAEPHSGRIRMAASALLVPTAEFVKVVQTGPRYVAEDRLFEALDAWRIDLETGIAAAEANAPATPPRPKADRVRPSFQNAVKYSRALDAKDKKDTARAKQLLTEVVKDQPDFKLAQADLLNLSN